MLRNRRKTKEQLVRVLTSLESTLWKHQSQPLQSLRSLALAWSLYFGPTYFDNTPTAILKQVLPTPPTFNALIIGYAPPIDTYATIKSMACLCSGIYNLDFSHVHLLPYPGVKVPWP